MGDQQVGKLFDVYVVQVYCFVVQFVVIGDFVFQVVDVLGKELEIFVGFELWVVFGQCEKLFQVGVQVVFGFVQGIYVGVFVGVGDGVVGGDDLFQGGVFVLYVLFVGFDQFWQFVMVLFEEYVDVGLGFVYGVFQLYQVVVEYYCVVGEQQQDNLESDSGQIYGWSFG